MVIVHLPGGSDLLRSPQAGVLTPSFEVVFESVSIATMFLAAWIMSRFEKLRFAAYGLPWQRAFGKLFWQGVLGGLIFESAEMLLIFLLGGFSFGSLALSGAKLAQYAALWAISFVLVGINEEFLFRGYPQFTLTSGIGFWPSAALLSLLFGVLHLFNPNEGWQGGLSVTLFGLFASFTLKRTGSLWFAVGFHAAADYAESFIYSVPDSGLLATGHLLNSSLHGPCWLTGGAIGPGGSILDFGLTILAFLVVAWLYPKKPPETSPAPQTTPSTPAPA